MQSKSTSSDPDPFSLLKNCLDGLIEPITNIISKSLQESVFQTSAKEHILDLCKKTALDKNELKKSPPSSKPQFYIKEIGESGRILPILSHMEANLMSNDLQSAYNKFLSTESAFLKVENDVLLNMEKPGQCDSTHPPWPICCFWHHWLCTPR